MAGFGGRLRSEAVEIFDRARHAVRRRAGASRRPCLSAIRPAMPGIQGVCRGCAGFCPMSGMRPERVASRARAIGRRPCSWERWGSSIWAGFPLVRCACGSAGRTWPPPSLGLLGGGAISAGLLARNPAAARWPSWPPCWWRYPDLIAVYHAGVEWHWWAGPQPVHRFRVQDHPARWI